MQSSKILKLSTYPSVSANQHWTRVQSVTNLSILVTDLSNQRNQPINWFLYQLNEMVNQLDILKINK